MLIPTRHKPKAGKAFSYPIGAEKLSNAIGEVPQAAELGIDFFTVRGEYGQRPYLIVKFQYEKRDIGISTPNAWLSSGHPGSIWTILIPAVPREALKYIRPGLEAILANEARAWLLAEANAERGEGICHFTIYYDPVEHHLWGKAGGSLRTVAGRK